MEEGSRRVERQRQAIERLEEELGALRLQRWGSVHCEGNEVSDWGVRFGKGGMSARKSAVS